MYVQQQAELWCSYWLGTSLTKDLCTHARMHARMHARTHTHTTILRPSWTLSRTTPVSRHQKGQTNLDLLEQEIMSGSGISWAICKSAPRQDT